MDARPFLSPALNENRNKIMRVFKQAMKETTQEKQDNKKKLTTDAEVIFNKYISGPQHNKKSDSIDKGLDTLLQYNK